ncbi:tRNA glutamyl-Q(34) synthetase GluQRS [Celeribacter litoreus]|uniref:tRNA glutamyl-Q(34) synthetase GluQRS n=1 Tax=Celeribacter litoreus TaxID=2876714 RepID=UPI001CCDE4B7|nr:tRNA glutamyl-Q(34) synthetase GluQRS [Celeribacter litoreus]MCA0043831.1 tRNA glutamyl-Q(34) synthetase GluQRS [Celeribacter litoreus]
MRYATRFAPSPTGPLHLGHAFSALTAARRAEAHGGTFLLRIEDGDISRCRPEWEALIYADLRWLGLSWPEPVLHVTAREAIYASALSRLDELGLIYPCSCTRRDVMNALSAPQEGAPMGPDGVIYPGTCRVRSMATFVEGEAIRLNMAKAVAYLGDVSKFSWEETGPFETGTQRLDAARLVEGVGDIVLARKDIGTAAYHLSVVLDDAAQGITEAVRGVDLMEATQIHRLLQALLDLPEIAYHHHDLIRDENDKRLAKRTDAKAIRKFREEGYSPEDVRKMIGL